MRFILKFSFKHHLMIMIEIFFNLACMSLNNISHIISSKAVFTFKMIITLNLQEFIRFHILNGVKQYVKWYFLVFNNTKFKIFCVKHYLNWDKDNKLCLELFLSGNLIHFQLEKIKQKWHGEKKFFALLNWVEQRERENS